MLHTHGPEGYPHLRLMALCETGTRGLLGAVFGPTRHGETHYACRLLPLLNHTMLLLADRAFAGDDFLIRTADTGAQLLIRLNTRRRPTIWTPLPDGSFLTRIQDRTFRIINVDITATCDDGTKVGDHYMLVTTLLNHRTDPAAQLARLYHERWEAESAFLALRHTLLTGRVLRSTDAYGLEQELWALLTVYQVLRRAMCDAVESRPGTDPDRAGFTIALQTAADQITAASHITADDEDGQRSIARAVLAGLLPARRPRLSARKVKCPMSRYGATPHKTRPLTSRSITKLDITVLAAVEQPTALPPQPTDTGRRSQVFQLLADAPAGQDWTPAQIADALKIEHVRSLAAQMGQWITQKFLVRTGRGRYRLHPQWTREPQPPAETADSTAVHAA